MVVKSRVVILSLICVVVLIGGIHYYNSEDNSEVINIPEEDSISPEALRELDRVNRLLGVKPSDLADPRSRSVSQQARNFVAREKLEEGEDKW